MKGDAPRHRPEFGDLPLGDPACQVPGQFGRAEPLHGGPQGLGGQGPVPARIEEPVKDVGPGFRIIQGLGQQVAVVVHHHSPRAQNAGERVVLGLGAAYPQHVIEQQIGNVVRGQALEL